MIALIEVPDKVYQPLGNVALLFFDSRGNIVRKVDPLGNELHTSFDIDNHPVIITRFLTTTDLGPVTPKGIPVTIA